jgi:hypothetical protein
MTGHTPSPSHRAAVARLDRDTLQVVAIGYRAQRQGGASDHPAYEAAVADLHSRAPDLPAQEACEAVSLIIARAAAEAPFWRGTST